VDGAAMLGIRLLGEFGATYDDVGLDRSGV
jgi:hypothetical protein